MTENVQNCGQCHECGGPISTVLDGEEWCQKCETYQRPWSYGWTHDSLRGDMMIYVRQPDGKYCWEGELPRGTRKVRIVFEGQAVVSSPVYRVGYAVALLERGPLKFAEYRLVPVERKPLDPQTAERLAMLRKGEELAYRNKGPWRRAVSTASSESGTSPEEGTESNEG